MVVRPFLLLQMPGSQSHCTMHVPWRAPFFARKASDSTAKQNGQVDHAAEDKWHHMSSDKIY